MPDETMTARLVCPGSGLSPTAPAGHDWTRCPVCGQHVTIAYDGTAMKFVEHQAPWQVLRPYAEDGGWEAPVRLSRQGPDGDWFLRGGRGVYSGVGGRVLVGVKLSDAEMRYVVKEWQAITKPPPVRPTRPADLPREYHVDVIGPRLGWWWYKITGEGLASYSEGQPMGLPRRSRAAALRHAQARVDRLARRDSDGPEKRDMLPRCVP